MKLKQSFILILCICLFLIGTNTLAQTVKVVADKKIISIGEQLKITISINDIKPNETKIIQWYNEFKDSLNHFEVISKTNIDTLLFSGVYYYHQSYIITSYDSGYWNIPVFSIQLKSIYLDSVTIKQTEPIEISVVPVDVSKLETYNDVTDIIPVEEYNKSLIVYIIAGSIIILLLAQLFFIYMKRSKKKKSKNDLKEVLEQLALIKNNGQNINAKEFYNQLYHIIRKYYTLQFNNTAVINCTTTEWLELVKKHNLSANDLSKFTDFLRQSDNIRFTKVIEADEKEQAVETAKLLIIVLSKSNRNNIITK